MIQLGQKVKDRLTGFEGIASGRCEYLTGCAQVLVQPSVDSKGTWVESRWLDDPRLVVIVDEPISIMPPAALLGPDKPAPRR